jgi:hypothetical protein
MVRPTKVPLGLLLAVVAVAVAFVVGPIAFLAGRGSSPNPVNIVANAPANVVADKQNPVKADGPTKVPSSHAKNLRDYLAGNLPTGKFEEIEWQHEPAVTQDFMPNGNWGEVADGTQTTLKFRAENPLGGMSVRTVKIRESTKGEWSVCEIESRGFRPYKPK